MVEVASPRGKGENAALWIKVETNERNALDTRDPVAALGYRGRDGPGRSPPTKSEPENT